MHYFTEYREYWRGFVRAWLVMLVMLLGAYTAASLAGVEKVSCNIQMSK